MIAMSGTALRALTKAELIGLSRSWLVRAWVGFALLTSVLPILIAGDREDFVSEVLGGWLALYFIPSAIMAAVLGAGSITQDLEVAADSILTRAVTRYDYIVAKLLSRIGVVTVVHLAATMPMVFLARRAGLDDATTGGLLMASLVTGVMLLFLTALGVLVGTVLRGLIVAVIVIMVAFSAEGLIFEFLDLTYLSASSVLDSLPDMIRGEESTWEQARILMAFGSATVVAALLAGAIFDRREL
jgi:hypothetical protein